MKKKINKRFKVHYYITGYYLFEYCDETDFERKYDFLNDSQNQEREMFQTRLKIYHKRNYQVDISATDLYYLHIWRWL